MALRPEWIRRRVVSQLRREHFEELRLCLPIGEGFFAPIHAPDNLHSLGEIFCAHEYEPMWRHLHLPDRWLDLGAHAGYFTLALAARHARSGRGGDWRAVLVEPDPRRRRVIEDGLRLNELSARAQLLTGLIGAGNAPVEFTLRAGMVSSADPSIGANQQTITVPTIDEAALLAALPPPYDLVKVDIEGAEYDFVRAYPQICRATRACLVEWHAPAPDAPHRNELIQALRAHGLTRHITLHLPRRAFDQGPLAWNGLELFLREGEPR